MHLLSSSRLKALREQGPGTEGALSKYLLNEWLCKGMNDNSLALLLVHDEAGSEKMYTQISFNIRVLW